MLVSLVAPFSLAAQSDDPDPSTQAAEALAGFEVAGGTPEGVANELLPCRRGNEYGSWFLGGLLEREWTEPREDIIAEAFGRIPWAACRDPRIDRWLASRLLDRLRAGDSYEAFWQAVVGRRAPTGYRVWEEIADAQDVLRVGGYEIPSRAYVGRFNFHGTEQQKKVGLLSGGERNRVHLAKLLRSGGNLLLLDEPTNDLDVETLRALEEALLSFPGCVVVISHDRWFLDRIATHVLAFEGDSEVVFFRGNYADYAADLRRRKAHDADQPRRIRYKRLAG